MFRIIAALALCATAIPCFATAASSGTAPQVDATASQPQTPALAHRARLHRHHVSYQKPGIAPLPAGAPARAVSTTQPAPVPNEAVSPPEQPSPQTQVEPKSFQLHYPPVGDGYVTGSSSQAMDDREAAKATGVQMTVPLAQ